MFNKNYICSLKELIHCNIWNFSQFGYFVCYLGGDNHFRYLVVEKFGSVRSISVPLEVLGNNRKNKAHSIKQHLTNISLIYSRLTNFICIQLYFNPKNFTFWNLRLYREIYSNIVALNKRTKIKLGVCLNSFKINKWWIRL